MTTATKRITLATIKAFIRKNSGKLFIRKDSDFDGMVDGVRECQGDFLPASASANHDQYTLGIAGAWFVGGSRNFFEAFENDQYVGYDVSNCCGSFVIAIQK